MPTQNHKTRLCVLCVCVMCIFSEFDKDNDEIGPEEYFVFLLEKFV